MIATADSLTASNSGIAMISKVQWRWKGRPPSRKSVTWRTSPSEPVSTPKRPDWGEIPSTPPHVMPWMPAERRGPPSWPCGNEENLQNAGKSKYTSMVYLLSRTSV